MFRCDAFDGIDRGLLCPFQYFGVPDDVDYAQIPWRNARFDEEALTQAVATQKWAQNALEQYRKRGGKRTLAFCVSLRHADFMADFFRGAGVRAVAVHAGAESAPRAASLEQLSAGGIDVIFAVDMFNEGVDVPTLDTVLMLRPTESGVIWQQQFGRGLRVAEGKSHLRVIDFIGNHRIFLTKIRTLLRLNAGDYEVDRALNLLADGAFNLPPGCEVTYELKAIEILKSLLRARTPDALRAFYEDFRERHGIRPSATETFHEGYLPGSVRPQFGSWFGFVAALQFEASFVKVAVHALRKPGNQENVLPEVLRQWFGPDAGMPGTRQFVAFEQTETGWRMAAAAAPAPVGKPERWREYDRPEIPELFGLQFNAGSWNQGFAVKDRDVFLLVTLDKDDLQEGHKYRDRFLSPTLFEWQSQNRTRRDSAHGELLRDHAKKGIAVHIFVRRSKKRSGRPSGLTYCGEVQFVDWEGDEPVTIRWRMDQSLPDRLKQSFKVGGV